MKCKPEHEVGPVAGINRYNVDSGGYEERQSLDS